MPMHNEVCNIESLLFIVFFNQNTIKTSYWKQFTNVELKKKMDQLENQDLGKHDNILGRGQLI